MAGVLLLASGACSNGQTFTTARTLEPQRVQHTLGLEVFVRRDPRCETPFPGPDCANYPIPFPSYVFRRGLTPSIEVGARFAVSGALGADLKLQLLRSPAFDFAIDPGLTISGANLATSLPFLLSFNVSQALTLTFIPRSTFLIPILPANEYAEDGLMLGAGLNVQIRFSSVLALTPTVHWEHRVWSPSGGLPYDYFTFGIAITYGSVPMPHEDKAQGVAPEGEIHEADSERSAPSPSEEPPPRLQEDGFVDDTAEPPR